MIIRDRFGVRVLSTVPHVAHVAIDEEDQLLFVALEANVKQPAAYRRGTLDRIATEATAMLRRPLSSASPREFARHVGDVIMADANRWRDVGAVIYAGALLSRDGIHVCTAGDLRVHLIESGVVTQVTRDHNAISDDPASIYADAFEGRPELKAQILTRAVPSNTHEPECTTWNPDQPALVLLCSSGIHRYGNPADYAHRVIAMTERAPAHGFVATLEYHLRNDQS